MLSFFQHFNCGTSMSPHRHIRRLFDLEHEPISDLTWNQARLPIKSHGFGLGHVEDTMSAAYVANVLETMKAVRDKLPSATCLDHLDDAQEELDAIRLGCAEIKEYVDTYGSHMLKIEETDYKPGDDVYVDIRVLGDLRYNALELPDSRIMMYVAQFQFTHWYHKSFYSMLSIKNVRTNKTFCFDYYHVHCLCIRTSTRQQ